MTTTSTTISMRTRTTTSTGRTAVPTTRTRTPRTRIGTKTTMSPKRGRSLGSVTPSNFLSLLDFRLRTCLDSGDFPAHPVGWIVVPVARLETPGVCRKRLRPAHSPWDFPGGVGTEGFGYADRD